MPLSIKMVVAAFIFLSCTSADKQADVITDTAGAKQLQVEALNAGQPDTSITVGNTTPVQLIAFARTLTGTPYKYASANPAQGFDCSGFVTYVFNHFGIAVPRTSAGFTNIKHDVALRDAKPGDLILFTGTDSTKHEVGHMGILVSKPSQGLAFIHATSGKAYGVTETPLNSYYQGRYVKAIRIFPQNDKAGY